MDQPPVAPTMSHEAPGSARGLPQEWLILVAVSLGMFMTLLDVTTIATWSCYVAALVAFLAMIPALFTGRRIGEHEGHEEMSRAERTAETV